uniref:FAST kinase leucine-rich domain-containing protein n=1 Tax=Spongospora subterranea TaxID=70186 RepID=A0A0H5R762_9EUKA|eukprot:CRZ09592.1 hypothetical protein [Spongospora subterranea]
MIKSMALNHVYQIRCITTRATVAHRALQKHQDASMQDYMIRKKFTSSLKHATSVSQLASIVKLQIENPEKSSDLLTPRNVSLIGYKVGQLHEQGCTNDNAEFKPVILNLIDKNLQHFSTTSSSSLLKSLAKWKWDVPRDLPLKISKTLFSVPRHNKLSLSRAISGMAEIGVADPSVWKTAISAAEMQLPYMDGFSLAECLSGISRSGLGDASFFDKVVAFIEPRTLSFDPISTSRIAFSLACVRDHIPQLASTFDKLSLQILRQLPMYCPVCLQLVVKSFAQVSPANVKLFDAIGDSISARQKDFPVETLKLIQTAYKSAGLRHNALESIQIS